MYEFPKPGKEQQLLRKLVSNYTSEVKFYFMPDHPPMESKGSFNAKVDLGGYFLDREFKVELNDAENFSGLAFHGRAFTGYDPFKRKYMGSWVDSGSPAVYLTEGYFSAIENAYNEISIGPDPQGNPMKMRMTTEVHKNKLLFNMFRVNEDGSEILITEMIHTKE
jgi:hypothetical protein